MARFSDEDISKIRDATDSLNLIREYAPDLRPKGRDYWACCPFHKEKSPSFKVDPHTGWWHCFGACSDGGDIFNFVMKTQNVSFPEAVNILADRAGIEVAVGPRAAAEAGRRKRLLAICSDTANFYTTYLMRSPENDAAQARDYLSKRHLGSEVATKWKLGYAPGRGALVNHLRKKGHSPKDMIAANVAMDSRSGAGLKDRFFARLMFTICDAQGQAIAFGGRVLDNTDPKYINSSATPLFDKSRNLYGLDQAKKAMHSEKSVLVVEGYTDVIALHKSGYENSVATLGTALTAQHVKILSRTVNRIIYIFDGDEAGLRAADKAAEHIDKSLSADYSASPVNLDVVCLPQGLDPADLMDSKEGQAQFKQLLANAKPLIEFAIDRRLKHWDLQRPEERIKALNESVSVLAPLKGTILASDYANYIADALTRAGGDFTEAKVLEALEKVRAVPQSNLAPEYEGPLDHGGETPSEGAAASATRVSSLDKLPDLSPAELTERELLAFIIMVPAARDYLFAQQIDNPFSHPMYRAVFESLQHLIQAGARQENLVSKLDESVPGVAQLVVAYNFEGQDNGGNASVKETTDGLLFRLRESALERTIRIIRSDLQKGGEESKDHLQALVEASMELRDLRNRRYK